MTRRTAVFALETAETLELVPGPGVVELRHAGYLEEPKHVTTLTAADALEVARELAALLGYRLEPASKESDETC